MKKVRFAALFAAVCLALTGCAAPHADGSFVVEDGSIPVPEITPAPVQTPEEEPVAQMQSVGQVAYEPMKIPSAFEGNEDFSAELYTLLTAAVRSGVETADMAAITVTETQFNTVRRYLILRNIWGNLADITKGEDGKIIISYSKKEVPVIEEAEDGKKKDDKPAETPAPVEDDVDTVKRFDDAAEMLLKTVVEPESTQLSAAIALYKHIAQCVVTDNEDGELGMYSALVQGKGTALSVANLYGFMLDQIGVKNVVVTSEDGSHAWNVLTIGESSFHCDLQMEAGLNDGQALNGFGLSDADVARTNGWNTWISENAALLTCAETLLPDVNAAKHADVDAAGNAVYFDGMGALPGIWKMDLAAGTVLQLTEEPVTALAVLGEHIYYVSEADSMMYSMRLDNGEVHPLIEGVAVTDMYRVGSELRYIAADDATQSENAISME